MDAHEYAAHVASLDLDQLLEESVTHNAVLSAAEDKKKLVNDRIRDLLVAEGMVKGNAYVRPDGIGATLQTRITKTVNTTKLTTTLLTLGVDAAPIIEACTDVNESALYVTVRVPPAKKGKS